MYDCTVGGSSFINGMMYHRGHAADYEDWVAFGAEGWSWEDNLPYFDMTEGNKQIGSLVSGQHHSDKGPLPIQQVRYVKHKFRLSNVSTECSESALVSM